MAYKGGGGGGGSRAPQDPRTPPPSLRPCSVFTHFRKLPGPVKKVFSCVSRGCPLITHYFSVFVFVFVVVVVVFFRRRDL